MKRNRNPAVCSGRSCLFFLLFAAAGCSDANRPVAVRGRVTLDGQPVDGALVKFLPEAKQWREANGRTKADGTFALTTFQNDDGAVPGRYKVIVEYHEAPALAREAMSQQDAMAAISKGQVKKTAPKYVIPSRYGDPNQTPLRHTVPNDGEAKLELQRDWK